MKYDVWDNNQDKKVAQIWNEGNQIKSTKESLVSYLKKEHSHLGGVHFSLDIDTYMDNLPQAFKNGYMSVRRVKGE